MSLRKTIDLTIAKGDATSAALDLQPYDGLSIKIGAYTAMDKATAVIHCTGCGTTNGTYADIAMTDGTTGFGQLGTYPEMASFPRYLKISSDTTATATAGLAVTAFVNNVHP
jgi:hypothetical protein